MSNALSELQARLGDGEKERVALEKEMLARQRLVEQARARIEVIDAMEREIEEVGQLLGGFFMDSDDGFKLGCKVNVSLIDLPSF